MEKEEKLSQAVMKPINGKWCWERVPSLSSKNSYQNKRIFTLVSLSCGSNPWPIPKDIPDLLSSEKNWINSSYEISLTSILWWSEGKTSICVLWYFTCIQQCGNFHLGYIFFYYFETKASLLSSKCKKKKEQVQYINFFLIAFGSKLLTWRYTTSEHLNVPSLTCEHCTRHSS